MGYRYLLHCILTCAQKLTLVSLIYSSEPTAKKWKAEKLKSKKKRIRSEVLANSPGNPGYGGKDWQKRKFLSLE